jgi:hypothetical protein
MSFLLRRIHLLLSGSAIRHGTFSQPGTDSDASALEITRTKGVVGPEEDGERGSIDLLSAPTYEEIKVESSVLAEVANSLPAPISPAELKQALPFDAASIDAALQRLRELGAIHNRGAKLVLGPAPGTAAGGLPGGVSPK